MRALRQSKTRLVVTEGCVEEVEGHLNLCKTYTRTSSWKGRVPYLVSQYITAGKPLSSFSPWLENFVGPNRPLDDIADFFFEIAGISVATIPVLDRVSPDTQTEIRDYWQRVQDGRRNEGESANIFAYRLAEHDTENYLAVLTERKAVPGNSALGYSSWLLTLDRAAWTLLNSLSEEARNEVRFSPVISLDFLFKYLAFGPRRDLVESVEKGYTRIFSSSVFETIPLDLIEVADSVRRDNAGLPERLIQRRIRDELDKQKGALGEVHKAGLNGGSAFKATV